MVLTMDYPLLFRSTHDHLMAELEKKAHSDFVSYMIMEPAMFHEDL